MFTWDWLLQAGLRATLLLGGLFASWRFFPATQPALRRWVLLAVSAGLLLAPWVSGWWDLGSARPPTPPGKSVITEGPAHSLPAVLVWLWLGGSLLVCARLAVESWALRRLIRKAQPWPAVQDYPQGDETGLLRLRRGGLTVLQSSAISGPCVAGGRRPVLLLPESARDWTPAQWRMVLTHERQHLRQGDLLLAWLPRLVLCFYWWHPLTHWLRRQFHAESEALCDGAVVERTGQGPREYIEFLMALNTARLPAHSAGMAMKSRLGQRIERLLLTPPRPVRWRVAAAVMPIIAALALTSISLRTVPVPAAATAKAPGPSAPLSTRLPEPSPSSARRPQGSGDLSAAENAEIALRLSANPFPEDEVSGR